MKVQLIKISNRIEPYFKNFPPLSQKSKHWLVKYLPIISLIVGILYGLYALSYWNVGHSSIINGLSYAPGGLAIMPINNLNFFYYVSFIFLLLDTIIYLVGFFQLKKKSDNSWLLMFLGILVYVIYAIFNLFSSFDGGIGKFIIALIFTVIGLYFLYQIKPFYIMKLKVKKVKK
jgi:hypothetical protein